MGNPITKDRIIDRLSRKYSLSKSKIEEAVDSQFKFVTEVMRKGEFESVRLRFWGVYKVKPYRLKKVKERHENDEEKDTDKEGGT